MGERIIDPKFNIQEVYRTMNILNPYRFGGGAAPSGHEPETLALMASIGWADDATLSPHNGLTYAEVYNVLDTYFASGKTDGWLSLMKAVYLFIGDKAIDHKWNAMNPQDTDAAFRILWYGGGVHSATGWKPNGTDAYGDTNFSLALNTLGSESYGFYSRTNIAENTVDIGAVKSGSLGSTAFVRHSTGNVYARSQGSEKLITTNPESLGMISVNRITTSEYVWDTRSKRVSFVNTATTSPTVNMYIGAYNNNNTGQGLYSSREQSYSFIGSGLSDTQITTHNAAVEQLQTALGRNV